MTDRASTVEWWRGAVIYQIYPRSFADSNGDGVGDLQGITARLDHVAALGVDAIWLSPFFTSPMRDFGYDVADYRDVDPIFGTLADLDALIARAHALGLKVIIDQVYSHTSDQHPWFTESRQDRTNPRADWYVWADPKPEGSPPSNWQSVFGGPSWEWDARRCQYYLHNFLREQPDLNVHNPEVQAELLDTARFWLDRGVDGFRLDAINFAMHDPALTDNPPAPEGVGRRTRPFDYQLRLHSQSHADIPAFLEKLRALLDSYGDRFTVAEIGGDDAITEMKAFTHGQSRLNSAYGFVYLYGEAMIPALVDEANAQWPGAQGEGWPSWAFSNHDAPRHVSRWASETDRERFAAMTMMLLMSLRGNVFVYQGEELGLPQAHVPFERLVDPEAIANWPQTLGRDGARTPMPWQVDAPQAGFSNGDPIEPWLPVDARHLPLAVDRQQGDPASMLETTRRLIAGRHSLPALRTGGHSTVPSEPPLLAFVRGDGADAVLCGFNLGPDAVAWELPEGWRIIESVGIHAEASMPGYSGIWAVRA